MVGASGRDPESITLESVRDGSVTMADVNIHPDTLEQQAQVAAAHANPQLAANFRRAAELTAFADHEVLELYEALRPFRSSAAELQSRADQLAERQATLCAELFREAAHVYGRRGLLRP